MQHLVSFAPDSWPYPFDFTAGELAVHMNIGWSATAALTVNGQFKSKKLSGYINELTFSGLTTRQDLLLLPKLETRKVEADSRIGHTGLVKLETFETGVTVSDVNFQLALSASAAGEIPVIDVHNFNADILGGHISSRKFSLDFNQPENRLDIKVSRLDLARVIEIQQLKGLSLSGRLDGDLPVEMNSEGIFVHNAYLDNAGRSGFIRYNPDVGTEQLKSNPLSGIALKALQDFRYSRLAAELDYHPDGKLGIALHMSGVSPEVAEHQKVNLNINIEQNVGTLLKSLRYAQQIDDDIDKRVQENYNHQ